MTCTQVENSYSIRHLHPHRFPQQPPTVATLPQPNETLLPNVHNNNNPRPPWERHNVMNPSNQAFAKPISNPINYPVVDNKPPLCSTIPVADHPTLYPQVNPNSHVYPRPRSLQPPRGATSSSCNYIYAYPTCHVDNCLPCSNIPPTQGVVAQGFPSCARLSRATNYDQSILPGIYPLSPCPLFLCCMTRDEFIKICTLYLDGTMRSNATVTLKDSPNFPIHSQPESVFFSVSKPDICTEEYVRRLVTYTQCSPSAFITMLIYLDRIAQRSECLRITPFNLHRLLVTALMLASKFLDDQCFSTLHYAKVGCIPTAREMNRLEAQFLRFVDFRLSVPVDEYLSKQHQLHSFCVCA